MQTLYFITLYILFIFFSIRIEFSKLSRYFYCLSSFYKSALLHVKNLFRLGTDSIADVNYGRFHMSNSDEYIKLYAID